VPQSDQDNTQVKFRRTGSERIKDGAKAILRRVESIKAKRRKRQNRDGLVISGPQTLDLTQFHLKFQEHKPGDISHCRSNPTSPGSNKNPIFLFSDVKVCDA
jgi:hypothetical protein